MDLVGEIRKKAALSPKRIVLPEGEEERTIKATSVILSEKIAFPILLGKEEKIKKFAEEYGVSIEGTEIVDPETSSMREKYAKTYYEIRKHKGMTEEKAFEFMKDPLYFGSLMVYSNDADGEVAGAINATGDVLRPALQTIKTAPGVSIVSSSMFMITSKKEYGEDSPEYKSVSRVCKPKCSFSQMADHLKSIDWANVVDFDLKLKEQSYYD